MAWISLETIVKEHQTEYYSTLEQASYCTCFIEFMLLALYDTLVEFEQSNQVSDQVKKLLIALHNRELSAFGTTTMNIRIIFINIFLPYPQN